MRINKLLNKRLSKQKNTPNISQKTIWITGASSGIGTALAKEFAKMGASLILSGRKLDMLEQVKNSCQHPDKHWVVPFDLTDAEQTNQAYQSAKQQAGKIDWLINNAGISQRSLIMETSEAVDRQLMEIDYFSQIRLTRLLLPDMIKQGGGKIVMVSSIAGLLGTQYRGGYSAAKAALHMWANSLRAELASDNIEVATVFPGFIQTKISVNALIGDGSKQGTMDNATGKGMTANAFAKQVSQALANGKEYVVVGGTKEMAAALVNRISPQTLYQLIRKSKVK